MSEKAPFSFLFSFNSRKNLTIWFTVILIVVFILVKIGDYVVSSIKEKAKIESILPKSNLELWQKDLMTFYNKAGRFPKDLRQLEMVVWQKENDLEIKESKLTNGNFIYVLDNYLYQYKVDEKGQVANIWAIPIGQKKDEGNTYFLLLTSQTIQKWKGLALNTRDIDILPKNIIPTEQELARLGLSKQIEENATKKTLGGIFNFGKKNN